MGLFDKNGQRWGFFNGNQHLIEATCRLNRILNAIDEREIVHHLFSLSLSSFLKFHTYIYTYIYLFFCLLNYSYSQFIIQAIICEYKGWGIVALYKISPQSAASHHQRIQENTART